MDERRKRIEHRVKVRKFGCGDLEVKVMRAWDQRREREKVDRWMMARSGVFGGKSLSSFHSS